MSLLDSMEFVKTIPARDQRATSSCLSAARSNLLREIDLQIKLLADHRLELRKSVHKRDGTVETKIRRPRSWVKYVDDTAYITVRIANKPVSPLGKGGCIIRCDRADVRRTFEQLRRWAASSEADPLLLEVVRKNRRRGRSGGSSSEA
ncbi:hypothetical protein [Pseudohoeflea coraliihabitans]|uniref:Uncharacterized protein n=1 Tax=Pseudohoeflea coraliihabitans TaxID=2860393 RepID=A0ABS6WPQ2_9HYPH|nr:hypothetical protein [Pseudohoeflea sp. DP4N28-3]MBW3097942.1 hypothetical protein [Pseudohoeflea sp. DP4N28-3]